MFFHLRSHSGLATDEREPRMRWRRSPDPARVPRLLGAGLQTPPECLTGRSPSFGACSESTLGRSNAPLAKPPRN